MKIRFIESPTGVFGLGYFVGDEVDLEEKKAKLLIDGGFAEVVSPVLDQSVPEEVVEADSVPEEVVEDKPEAKPDPIEDKPKGKSKK